MGSGEVRNARGPSHRRRQDPRQLSAQRAATLASLRGDGPDRRRLRRARRETRRASGGAQARARGRARGPTGDPQRAMPASGLKEDEPSPGYTAGRACRRFAYGAAGEALIPLLLLSSLIISGCASMLPHPPQPTVTPAPPQPTVTLTTTRATTYYSVHGTTTSKIFEDIKAHGLNEQDGKHAEGLTSAKSEMALKTLETSALYTSEGALCTPESVTITLDLLVTLPRHERPNDLSKDLRERWQQFVEGVAGHEQHHVDIAVNGANVLKTGIEAVLKNRASCAELAPLLRRLWKSQHVEIDKA